jgi:hypothetical protein
MGGIKQTSTIDVVIAILNPISNTLSSTRNTKTIAQRYLGSPSLLCMDIQGAFNATSTKILANIMHFRKIPKYQVGWVRTMGQDRQLSFSFYDKIEDPQPTSDVLPQGSLSSPILFAIMAAAILEIPPPSIKPPPGFPESKRHSAKIRPPKALPPLSPQKTTSYVDGVSVSLLGKGILINTTNMALIAENLIHRASTLNLSFSVEKTDLIHFFKPKSSAKPKDIS